MLEQQLLNSEAEREVGRVYARRVAELAAKLRDVEASLEADRSAQREKIRQLQAQPADDSALLTARRALAALPRDAAAARETWTRAMQDCLERARPLAGMSPHAQPCAGDPQGSPEEQAAFELSRRNFLALMFCLMVCTAGLPHLLTRFYTTPTVLGIFWHRTSRHAATVGMLSGLAMTVYYMVINAPPVRLALGLQGSCLWFGIQPVSAGVFGVLAGFAAVILLSLLPLPRAVARR